MNNEPLSEIKRPDKKNKKSKKSKKNKKDDKDASTNDFKPIGSAFDFLSAKRDPKKRKIKPSAGIFNLALTLNNDEESGSDDEDYVPKDEDDNDDLSFNDDDDADSDKSVNAESEDVSDEEEDDKNGRDEQLNDSSQDAIELIAQSNPVVAFDGNSVAKKVLICSVCCGDR